MYVDGQLVANNIDLKKGDNIVVRIVDSYDRKLIESNISNLE
jgi:hypothetical protein